jgi:hypothetical protein
MTNANIETMKSQTFGIEIEFVGISQECAARAVHSVVGGHVIDRTVVAPDGRKWKVVSDGSVAHVGGGCGELVSPVLKYEDIETLQNVVRAMRHAGARAHSSAGIHVHVGAADMTAKQIVNVVKSWNRQEKIINKSLNNEARAARWCRTSNETVVPRILRSRPSNMKKLAECYYGNAREAECETRSYSKYSQARYLAVNLHNLFYTGPSGCSPMGTIEFRCFNSTVHAGKIRTYVNLALAVVAKGRNGRGASVEQKDFNPSTAKYDMRQWLIKLGLIGNEFKAVRNHLMKNLPGSSRTAGTGQTRGGHARRAA